jgi:hypothetical protein
MNILKVVKHHGALVGMTHPPSNNNLCSKENNNSSRKISKVTQLHIKRIHMMASTGVTLRKKTMVGTNTLANQCRRQNLARNSHLSRMSTGVGMISPAQSNFMLLLEAKATFLFLMMSPLLTKLTKRNRS